MKQKTTLPLIHLLDTVEQAQRRQILAVLSDPARQLRELLRPWFDETDAFDYDRHRADKYVQSAIGELDTLPPGPIRDVLHKLAEFVITRQN